MVTCPSCGRENPEGFRFCGNCGAILEPTSAAREMRKTITVVFSDVTGSTALGERLDPESLRRVMGRYFDEMQAVVERHEGSVEKFIGDAVMAVFGIPTVHEDDALRAVRAAAEMRERLGELNDELERVWGVRIEVRTGVNTGEVVAGDGSGGQRFAVGDAVNVAKRFEEAAPPGEILLGETTQKLVRDAVVVESVEALELKGKRAAVNAFRLLSIEPGAAGRARRLDSPMVGRERERSLLAQAYERAVDERACHLFTVLGAAGVGKSRLIAEFLHGIGESATVVQGRCLPYGEGITFWPVLEVVRMLREDPASVGLAEATSPSDETSWAMRKLFEARAQQQPLVVVFDDVQWGEPTFLDLVEHVADLSRDAPILLVCLARPELLDARPGWAGGKFNATSVLLEPLAESESAELIDNLLGRAELDAAVRARVAEAAEGNPLFVEEMLGMLIDDGLLERHNGHWIATGDLKTISVPPTIQALLSARLDRLAPDERAVIEHGSVEGTVFHHGAVVELAPPEVRNGVTRNLHDLVRKELLRPGRAEFAGEDAFRFRHILIRDAAYESMPKEQRAELHERFSGWLERTAGARVIEYEEILGFHLEQAHRYRVELAPLDDRAQSLGTAAATYLKAAAQRALARGDAPAATSLFERALELVPPDSPDVPKMLSDLGHALSDRGEFQRAERILADASSAADAQDEPAIGAIVSMRSTWVQLLSGGATMHESKAKVDESVRALEKLQDERGLAEAYSFLGTILMWTGRCADAVEVLERSVGLAQRQEDTKTATRSIVWLLTNAIWGPMPVEEGLRLGERFLEDPAGRQMQGSVTLYQGVLHAMVGRWEEAREEIRTGRKMLEELGQHVIVASTSMPVARMQLFTDHLAEAEEELREGYRVLEQMGEKGYLSTVSALLASVLCAQGRYEEAEPYAQEARRLGAEDDVTTQLYWRCAQAEVLASRGEIDEALRLAQEGQDVIDATDYTTDRAAALMSRAEVEKAADNRDRARSALEQAVALFEEKGDVTGAAHVRGLIAEV